MESRTCLVERSLAATLALAFSFSAMGCSAASSDVAASDAVACGDADSLIHDAYVKLENASSVEIQQTGEQTSQPLNDGKPLGSPQSATQRSTIEIDNEQGIARLAMNDPRLGDIVVLRSHDRVAVKAGSDAWGPPSGPFAALGNQLANPMGCPAYAEGETPRWQTVGEELLNGKEVTVVATVGDSAVAYVQRLQEEGFASMFPDEATRPKLAISAYSMRAWIAKSGGGLLLRQEKTLKGHLAFPTSVEVEFTNHIVQDYGRYGEVRLTIPEAAKQILDAGPEQ